MSGLHLHSPQVRLQLSERQPLRLSQAYGSRLRGLSGVLWVTIDNDPRDQVLQPGESLEIDQTGSVLVTALGGPATVALCAPAASPSWRRHALPAHWVAPAGQLATC